MTPQDLIAAFETLADAPDGVTRLRELVLQLAVRGRLVPQDPSDEPASVLLERIEAAKSRLIAEKKVRKPRALPRMSEEEMPFEIPAGWAVSRFQDVHGHLGAGSTPLGGRRVYVEDGVPFLRSQNVWNDGLRLREVARIPAGVHAKMAKTTVHGNDVLLNITGASIGRAAVVPADFDEANVSQHVAIVRQIEPRMNRWVHLFLTSPHGFACIMDAQVGISREGLSMSRLREFVLPLPPLAEQRRIVARADELMGLLDHLEAARNARETTRTALRDAALAALQDADTPEEVEAAWARIAERMGDLFIDPTDVNPLRQTVLQLAVRGRLVLQDPSDEPASAALVRTEGEKARLVREGKIRKPKPLPPVSDDEVPFEVPPGWAWAPFGNTHINRDAERIPLSREERSRRKGQYDYYGASGVINHIDGYLFDSPLLLIGEDGANLVLRSTPIAFIADGKFWVNNHAHVLDSVEKGSLRYLAVYVNAIDLKPYVTGTAQPKLNQRRMNCIPCAFPPLAEQHRIVAKVDELMGLLDRLERHLAFKTTAHDAFAAAAVHDLEA